MSEVEGYCVCDGASTPVLDCGVSAHRAKAHELRAGSSVPEAARAADERAWQYAECLRANTLNLDSIAYPHILVNAFMGLADAEVAAASVELQQEVDRLSAECEALRGTVAEERAATGRVQALLDEVIEAARFEAQERLDQHHARAFAERELAALQGRIGAVAMELENAADEKIATTSARDLEHISHQALRVAAGKVRAALASPREGQ